MNPLTQPHRLLAGGALGVAVTTAAEVVTAPYSPFVSQLWLNPSVHVAKVLAVAVFVTGTLAVATQRRAALGRTGVIAAVALAVATTIGAVPYSLAEAALDPSGTPAAAAARLDAAYDGPLAWVGPLASAGMLLLVIGLVALALVVLRRRLLPRWRPLVSLGALPLGVLAGVLGEAGLAVPHPPTWVFLCLGVAYAAPLATEPHRRATTGRTPQPTGAAA
jgi:hypothetical protein